MAERKEKMMPFGLTGHTRSSLRKLLVFSFFGLALVYGTKGDVYEINGFVTGITLPPSYVMVFAGLGLVNYLFVSLLAFRRDMPDFNSEFTTIDKVITHTRERMAGIEGILQVAVRLRDEGQAGMGDVEIQEFILSKGKEIDGAIAYVRKMTGRFSEFNTSQMLLFWLEFLIPMVAGSFALIKLLLYTSP